MNRTQRVAPLLLFAMLVAVAIASVRLSPPATAAKHGAVADNYIVTFKPGVDARTKTNDKAKAYGLQVRHIYDSAISGFAGFVPPGQLKKLQADPDVASVVEDRYVSVLSDQKPSGIRRTQADRNATSQVGTHSDPISADIAIVDTGIDPTHPDLNVAGGINCVPGESSYADMHGHGTHVAGTVGALDNGIGVVGVAPGVRVWAVRVLDASGQGQWSDVVCGVDWITARADTIDVANLSLGEEGPVGSCTDGALHEAICHSVAAGVTYVVAAGNSTIDASGFVPAAYDEVITVSAIQDFDGAPGGKAGNIIIPDDALAFFSNFGAPVDIAAPGFDIYSTWLDGDYNAASGTSMASPHVAGAAAIVRFLEPGASPARVKAALLGAAWPQASANGFSGDPDGFAEPLLNVGSIGGDPLPAPAPACTLGAEQGTVGSSVTIACENFAYGDYIRVYWDVAGSPQRGFFSTTGVSGSGTFTIPATTSGVHQVIAQGSLSGVQVSLPFTVVPGLKLSATSGKVGSNLTASLTGFPAGAQVQLIWDGSSSPIKTGSTSSSGAASLLFQVPEGVTGLHVFRATTDPALPDPSSAETNYTVIPGVSVTPSTVKVGNTVTVTLKGFSSGESIDVFWRDQSGLGTKVAGATATVLGSATAAFTVPDAIKGAHTIESVGSAGGVTSTMLTVYPALTLSQSSGFVGSKWTLAMTGFGSGESLTVRWYETSTTSSPVSSLATVSTSASGRASIEITVPDTVGGLHRVEVVGPVSGTLYGFYTVSAAIALSPASGLAGTSVTSTITGFPANEPISIRWYVTSFTNTVIASASASTTGSASVSFAVPSDAAVGDHKVEAVGNVSSRRVSAQFAVESSGPPPPVDPTCKLDRSSGPVGAALVVTCANFAASENINIYWDDTNSTRKSSIWSGTARGGSSTIFVPDATAGDHKVIAIGATSANRVEQTFTVVPSLKLSATTSKVGTFVSATLKGFGPGESVALSWDGGAALARVAVSVVGSGSVSFPVPEATKGQHLVGTTGETSALQASTPLSVEPSLTLSPASGYVGSNSAITLRGFSGNESVTILWYGGSTGTTALATVAVDGRGSGSVGLTIPSATKGNHRVEGSGDAASIASASFTVLPRLTLSATTGTVGTTVQAGLTGFGESEQIRLEWFDTTTASSVLTFVTASADGATTANIVIPEASNGSHKFMATGTTTGASSYLFFVVKAGLTLSPGNGAPGASVTVSLTGYRAGETVNVAWFSTATKSSVVASGVASAFGSSTATFTVPTDASIGDHKVEGTGQPSVARASAVFTVRQGGPSGASTSIQTDEPSVDMPIGEDFSQKSADGLPVGWSIARGSSEFVAIKLKGEGESARLNLTGPADVDDLWLIRDGVKFRQPDVRVKLHFSKSGAAGVVLAWNGPQDYIAVVADPESDQVDVIEVVNASVRTSFATRDGILDVDRGRDYWLRAESGVNGAGDTWISLYWSTDGENFESVGVAEGLSNLYGMVGLTMVGSETTNVGFGDFVARPSHATEPAVVEQPLADPTSTPVPTETESPSEESTPTQQPAQSPEPAPSEIPTDTPTAQPTATETPVPSPTATIEPTLEPTVGEAPPPEPTSEPTVEDESAPE